MRKILIVEDNGDVRENISELLELSGYSTITAENGKSGVELAEALLPDLIICDIMMPEMDGYEVLKHLTTNPKTSSIPFIFLTAKSEKSDFRKGMGMGADDYVVKPYSDDELLDAVEIRLSKSDQIKKTFNNTTEGLSSFIDEAKGTKELEKLSNDRKSRLFKKKQHIFLEDNFANVLYFIASGKVKTYMTNEYGKEYITGMHGKGEFIGYKALLENTPYNESAMTIEDSDIVMIPKDDFLKLLYTNRDVAVRFIKMLSNNILEKEEGLLRLAYNSVRQRVAEALLLLQNKYQEKSDDQNFSMAVSREDLANIVGTAKESLIRTLSDFKDENLIEIKGSKITLVNAEKLKRIINPFG